MEENKPKSAWARRQEYSKNLSKSLSNPTLSAFKRKRTAIFETVSRIENNKPERTPKVNFQISKTSVAKKLKLLDNPSNKPEIGAGNKSQLLDKTPGKNVAQKPVNNVTDRPKAVATCRPVSRHAAKVTRMPVPSSTTVASNSKGLRKVAVKTNSVERKPLKSKVESIATIVKPVIKRPVNKKAANSDVPPRKRIRRGSFTISSDQKCAGAKILESNAVVVKPVGKRPCNANPKVSTNLGAPPGKRVRRGSFTVDTEKKNDAARPTIEPKPKAENISTKKMLNKAPTKPVVSRGFAKLQSRPDHPVALNTKAAVRTKTNAEQTKNVKKPLVLQIKRAGPKSIPIVIEQSTTKRTKLEDDLDSTVANSSQVLKTSAKQNGTPLVRMPIRERLALWRERRQTLGAESVERRKTISLLSDILNASRHERCFTPAPASVYSCPYGTRKEIVNRTSRRQKPLHTQGVKVEENQPETLTLPSADTKDLMQSTTSFVDQENKPPTPTTIMASSSALRSHQDIEETLMGLKDSLVNGLPMEDVIIKLNELKGNAPDIEKNAHYWEIKALIAESNGSPDEAYQIYVAAASNEAEPIEVITEALEKFLARLDESQVVQPSAKTPTSSRKREVKSEGGRRKKRHFNQREIFESTLIQYAMQKYSPFVKKISKALELDSPPFAEYVTPVRRSARVSKSAKKNATNSSSVSKSRAFAQKENKALTLHG